MIDWTQFETILLDMDGTILDLAYDNHFWRELVPRYLAARSGDPLPDTRERLFGLFDAARGGLDWYCLDHWSETLDVDLRQLKTLASQRIRYLAGARDFLHAARAAGKSPILVTNAHGDTLHIKRSVAGLDRYLTEFVSSHEFGYAKEQAPFWPALQRRVGMRPARTLFVDDSLSVLDAARDFGIGATVAISRPDSLAPANDTANHVGIDSLAALLAGSA